MDGLFAASAVRAERLCRCLLAARHAAAIRGERVLTVRDRRSASANRCSPPMACARSSLGTCRTQKLEEAAIGVHVVVTNMLTGE